MLIHSFGPTVLPSWACSQSPFCSSHWNSPQLMGTSFLLTKAQSTHMYPAKNVDHKCQVFDWFLKVLRPAHLMLLQVRCLDAREKTISQSKAKPTGSAVDSHSRSSLQLRPPIWCINWTEVQEESALLDSKTGKETYLACFQAATGGTNTHEKQRSLRALVQQRGWRQFLSPCVRGHLSHTPAPDMDYLMK